jgi:hypothetical protein
MRNHVLAAQPVDFRKDMGGLATLLQQALRAGARLQPAFPTDRPSCAKPIPAVTRPMPLMLTALAMIGVVLLLLWAALVLALSSQQERLIFPGWGFGLVAASGLGPGAERLALDTPDGVRLVGGLHLATRPSRGLLLVFGGNAEDTDWRLRDLAAFVDDLDLAGFFYRGYGPSGGTPSQDALAADAALIHDRLVARLRPPRVLAAGFSLGAGVTAELARARRLDGAVLVTPFDSVEALAAASYPFVPVRRLLRHPFRADRALAGLPLPVAVIGAGRDAVVPRSSTERLVAVLARPALVAWVEGADHVSLYGRPEYRRAFAAALGALIEAAPTEASSGTPQPQAD